MMDVSGVVVECTVGGGRFEISSRDDALSDDSMLTALAHTQLVRRCGLRR